MKHGLIFHAIAILLLILVIFQSQVWGWVLYSLWWLRIICLQNSKFLGRFIVIQLLLTICFVYQKQQAVSHLDGEAQIFMMDVAVTDIKVEGDLLSLKGETSNTKDGM
ncbi:MAG: hypothetical protein B7Z25_06335, partial [Aerococcus viridans]